MSDACGLELRIWLSRAIWDPHSTSLPEVVAVRLVGESAEGGHFCRLAAVETERCRSAGKMKDAASASRSGWECMEEIRGSRWNIPVILKHSEFLNLSRSQMETLLAR